MLHNLPAYDDLSFDTSYGSDDQGHTMNRVCLLEWLMQAVCNFVLMFCVVFHGQMGSDKYILF